MGASDDDRARAPQKVLANRFGQRAEANLAIEHLFELGVAARDCVADNHQVEIAGDMVGLISCERPDSLGGQEVAHRRVDVLVRPAHVEPSPLQHGGHCRHRGPADSDEMHPCWCHGCENTRLNAEHAELAESLSESFSPRSRRPPR